MTERPTLWQRARGSKAIALGLRVAASTTMLAVLVTRVRASSERSDQPESVSILPAWHTSTALWFFGALGVAGFGAVLATWRWNRVLHAFDVSPPFRLLLSSYLAGLFVGNFLPSTVGGDVLRIRRSSTAIGDPGVAFASVLLERLTGWLVLPFLTLFTFLINPGLRELGRATAVAFGVSLATIAALSLILAAANSHRMGGRLAGHGSWLRFLGAVHTGVRRLRERPADALDVLAAGLAYQLAVVISAWMAAHALGVRMSPTAALAFVPAVAVIQVMPLSIGGLGFREGAFALFLGPLGVASSRAIALGLCVYLINLLVSLAGAPAFAFGGRRRHPASPDAPNSTVTAGPAGGKARR